MTSSTIPGPQSVARKSKEKIPRLTDEAGGNKMFSGTELLFANEFVKSSYADLPEDHVQRYREHVDKKRADDERKFKIEAARGTRSDHNPDDPNVKPIASSFPQARYKLVRRKIYVDSRHRDVVKYPDASDFVISWGRIFHNVSQMRLVSLEFANVVQSVNRRNNVVPWVNEEDIRLPYVNPYIKAIPPGSYNLSQINTELTAQLRKARRNGGQLTSEGKPAPFHYFIVTTNEETNYVGFTSIVANPANSNPVNTIAGSTKVIFKSEAHGYDNDERIHIIGVMGIVGGVLASDINGPYIITKIDDNSFSFEMDTVAQTSQTGGGTLARSGREAKFQFLFGSTMNPLASVLGFPVENSSETIIEANPLTSIVRKISAVVLVPTEGIVRIISVEHRLKPGDRIYLNNFHVSPSIYENDQHRGIFRVFRVPSPDVIEINYTTEHISDVSEAFIGTQMVRMHYPNHRFNRIVSITQKSTNVVLVQTLFQHDFDEKSFVRIANSNCEPIIDGYYKVFPVDMDTFAIKADLAAGETPLHLTKEGFAGILTFDHDFYLYNVQPFGGFLASDMNNVRFSVREIENADYLVFNAHYGFSTKIETGGGESIRINSKLHGWRGTQSNYIDEVSLYKPIKLSGDNYCFMCTPGMASDSIAYTGGVRDIFAKIFISAVPGVTIFNDFDASLVVYTKPIPRLGEIRFTIRTAEDDLVSFGGLDYSFGLEITELTQVDENDEYGMGAAV